MNEQPVHILDPAARKRVGAALGRIPQSLYVMTAHFEGQVRATLVHWVQQISNEPAMLAVSLLKGRDLVPLIHNSHAFGLSEISQDDRLTLKRLADMRDTDEPLLGLATMRKTTGSPILGRSLCFFDCELVRHIDVEADHDLYIGLVLDGGVLENQQTHARLREEGLRA